MRLCVAVIVNRHWNSPDDFGQWVWIVFGATQLSVVDVSQDGFTTSKSGVGTQPSKTPQDVLVYE